MSPTISSILLSVGSSSNPVFPANSKWFMQSIGVQNLHKMLDGFEDKSAQAVCTFAYSEGPGHEPLLFQGRTDVSSHPNNRQRAQF